VLALFRMARTYEELPLYKKVLEFWEEVTAILENSKLRRNRDLHEQIESALSSVDANMQEGFEAPSDAAFAKAVFTAKGSTAEVISRMKEARRKNCVTEQQLARVVELGEPLGRMMGGFIKYLAESGFTDRGRHSVAPTPRKPFSSTKRRPGPSR